MSALVPEPPALVRSPEEWQHGGRKPGHVLAQLSAALENPNIKALEWSEDGQGVLVHAELYEEEMGKNKELFPELADLSCVVALQVWLLAYGFKLKGEKVNSQVLLLQHPDFQRVHPTTEEPGTLRGDAGLSAKEQRKRKKKRPVRSQCHPGGAMSQDRLGQLPRLRPLYQYINFDMPELMHPSAEEDEVPGLAQPNQVPAAPGRATAPQLEGEIQQGLPSSFVPQGAGLALPVTKNGWSLYLIPPRNGRFGPPVQGTWASSTPEIPASGVGDISMQADIDRMLRYAAHLVPPLFPQYK